MLDAHMVGFEKEALFSRALKECREAHNTFKAKTLKAALQIVCPDFMEELFAIRPCSRKLMFIGDNNLESNNFDSFFECGKVYDSVDFNGGTYGINGYDARIGCNYFEVCDDL